MLKSYSPGLQNMISFEESMVTEVIKLKQSHLGGALIKRGRFGQRDRQMQTEGCVKRRREKVV